jgi:retron-type reverse transcriptase
VALKDFLGRLVGRPGKGRDVEELCRRLGMASEELRAVRPAYAEFSIPKRGGGARRIMAPDTGLKALQRRVLKRLLARLPSHPAATGYERGHSIVTNAHPHVGKAVVVRLDVKDFFTATRDRRVQEFFRRIGWNREASELLTRICTHQGGLPQGAPTSPRLSNLVNHRLDARLAGLAGRLGAAYTRYADDMTFSFSSDNPRTVRKLIRAVKLILADEGYSVHLRKKLRIRRRHQRQIVTGLVVNTAVNLPRETRRWLRAVRHRLGTGGRPTLSDVQVQGWLALEAMVIGQGRR